MNKSLDQSIFENGSTTYYWSSRFFPKAVRDDVFKLYSFVRVVDDLIDAEIADVATFEYIVKRWKVLKKTLGTPHKKRDDSISEHILQNICYVVHRYDCDPAWVDAFLSSMRMDIDNKIYVKLEDTLGYMYGSAEVIGLFMAKIMKLPETACESAKMQGRAMQYINFIRDIAEDNLLGRQYFPREDLQMFGLKDLSEKEATKKPAEFREFIEYQIGRYAEWQQVADKGFMFIPKRLRVALRSATDMYTWTSKEIAKEPYVVYERKIKPTKSRVLRRGVMRVLYG
jgi:15-cis-phytoene synthase